MKNHFHYTIKLDQTLTFCFEHLFQLTLPGLSSLSVARSLSLFFGGVGFLAASFNLINRAKLCDTFWKSRLSGGLFILSFTLHSLPMEIFTIRIDSIYL